MIVQIISSEKGKQCDMFPCGSIHEGEYDNKGFKIADKSNWIDIDNFVLRELEVLPPINETKLCPNCNLLFSVDAPFVKATQISDKDMCMRCYERKYIVGIDEYKEALRIEIINELNLKK